MEVADGGVRASGGCRNYGVMELRRDGTTETRNLAASSGKTDLLNYGIMETRSYGNTELRKHGDTETRIYGYTQSAELQIYGFTDLRTN